MTEFQEQPFLASLQQRDLWMFQELHPESAAYNLPIAFRVSGPLDHQALRESLQRLSARHSSLRSCYLFGANGLEQVLNDRSLAYSEADAATEEAAWALVEEHGRRPFDLECGTARVLLVNVRDDLHLLLVVVHHVACDGWSLGVIKSELGTLYQQALGNELAAPTETADYRAFSAWQQERLASPAEAQSLKSWVATLAGYEGEVFLPGSRLPSSRPEACGAQLREALPEWVMTKAERTSQQERVSPFTVLLTAFAAAAGRLSGREDLIIGTPFAARPSADFDDTIGMFANMLPLRLTVPATRGNDDELRRHVQGVVLTAFEHQHTPFSTISSELRVEHEEGRWPLIQLAFVFANARPRPLLIPGAQIEERHLGTGSAMADIIWCVEPKRGEHELRVDYNSDIYSEREIITLRDAWLEELARLAPSS